MILSFSDTHCHLDLLADHEAQIVKAKKNGVNTIIVPAVEPKSFEVIKKIASDYSGIFYSVGIHPCRVNDITDNDLLTMENFLSKNIQDPKLVAIGEIGLDFFFKNLPKNKMERFYFHQLQLANKFSLPVLLHVRRSQDLVLKYYKKSGVTSGIAHAFNGSKIQAQNYFDNGLLLGFGGSMTFERALQIRRLATTVPDNSFVLETDSPDMVPSWKKVNEENTPSEIPGIARCLAKLRNNSVEQIAYLSSQNARNAIPRLRL